MSKPALSNAEGTRDLPRGRRDQMSLKRGKAREVTPIYYGLIFNIFKFRDRNVPTILNKYLINNDRRGFPTPQESPPFYKRRVRED